MKQQERDRENRQIDYLISKDIMIPVPAPAAPLGATPFAVPPPPEDDCLVPAAAIAEVTLENLEKQVEEDMNKSLSPIPESLPDLVDSDADDNERE